MKLLLTGFEPFGGETVNPSWEAAKLVSPPSGVDIVRLLVPTVFGRSIAVVTKAMEEHQPDAVLCLGQAGGRTDLTPERVAINLSDARIPDNDGVSLVDEPIVREGETAYFSSLPIKAMVAAIHGVGLPASVSNSAGTYVCNHLMYGVLHHISQRCTGVRGGFMHIPFIPAQTVGRAAASMALSDIVRGVEAAVAAIFEHPCDICVNGGKED